MARVEKDALGEVEVDENAYYGAQTQRSLNLFTIGHERMPNKLIGAYGVIKKAAAEVNAALGKLSQEKARLIVQASEEVIAGKWASHFPLTIWQTGSGTQTNMNVNEVIANRANELAGEARGSKHPIHPNDDVNMSQSSNDTFPTAMHMAAVEEIYYHLLPNIQKLKEGLSTKEKEFRTLVKVGRTHLMDAQPLTLGQEFSAFVALCDEAIALLEQGLNGLYGLAIGGTAVGTGFLAPKGFGELMAEKITTLTGFPFLSAPNKFASLSTHGPLLHLSGVMKTFATSLIKIANDLSWLGSGPMCGLGELIFSFNEPGSSIMPGKVNPTQCEAAIMAAVQVMGHDAALAIANSRGNFELNVMKPLIIFNFLRSSELLAETCRTLTDHFILNLRADEEKIAYFLSHSLMLVTALVPRLGYDKSAAVALKAYKEKITLQEACSRLGYLTPEEFESLVHPEEMV